MVRLLFAEEMQRILNAPKLGVSFNSPVPISFIAAYLLLLYCSLLSDLVAGKTYKEPCFNHILLYTV